MAASKRAPASSPGLARRQTDFRKASQKFRVGEDAHLAVRLSDEEWNGLKGTNVSRSKQVQGDVRLARVEHTAAEAELAAATEELRRIEEMDADLVRRLQAAEEQEMREVSRRLQSVSEAEALRLRHEQLMEDRENARRHEQAMRQAEEDARLALQIYEEEQRQLGGREVDGDADLARRLQEQLEMEQRGQEDADARLARSMSAREARPAEDEADALLARRLQREEVDHARSRSRRRQQEENLDVHVVVDDGDEEEAAPAGRPIDRDAHAKFIQSQQEALKRLEQQKRDAEIAKRVASGRTEAAV